jgi:hypothetical protein
MKKYLILILILSTFFVPKTFAQEGDNEIKVNVPALIIRNISIQYERKIGAKTSVAIALRDIPYGKLPLQSTISNYVNNPFVEFDKLKAGSFGVTPEVRFYLGKKGAMRGFYLGPFINYSNYKTDLPIQYNNSTGIFNGEVKTITGGLQVGAQFKLSSHFYLDWWIVGPNYGGAKGDLIFTGALTSAEQSVLRDELKQLQSDVPFHFIKSYSVTGSGASINAKGPWAGLRGLGLNLAYRF